MKLVLAAKSLPLEGINRTMKRLQIPLFAALALPTSVNAESTWYLSGRGGKGATFSNPNAF